LRKNNISTIVKNGLCVGCGTCVALCPNENIIMSIDLNKGIYAPKINKKKCNCCNTCLKICPGHEVDFNQHYFDLFQIYPQGSSIGHYQNCYIGSSMDSTIKRNSSSGGVFTALLIFAIEKGIIDGVLLTKMKKDNPLESEPFIAKTKKEILEASQDKYCPVPMNSILKEILNSKKEEKFAVVGLPCHIHGIRKAEKFNPKIKEKIILKLGLFCSYGINFLATEYMLKKMNIPKNKTEKIDYRKGDFPGFTLIQYDKKTEKIKHLDFWAHIFSFPSWFSPFRCMLCADQTSELADISIGSGWFAHKEYGNKNHSVIISRTEFTENMIKESKYKGNIEIIKLSPERVVKLEKMQKYKKNNLKTNINLFKLFKKKVPTYTINNFDKPHLKTYFRGILIYSQSYLSNKKYLWSLMSFIQFIKTNITNKLF